MLPPEPTVRIRLVGEELRRHREMSKLTIAQAAMRIGVTASKLSRMETGKHPQKCDEVAGLLGVYGVTGEDRRHVLELTQIANRPGLWRSNTFSYAQRVATLKLLESQAIRLINFESELIPGLLQTVPYIQALMRHVGRLDDEDEIGERVASRVHRQAILRKPGAPIALESKGRFTGFGSPTDLG
ncbi:MAG TPA: Scr1 family TA system antitoxin-like transcriptional regulator [Actinophytocola sp.]|nr:Scr1 family TA system antitoxin-like transcriptional regulator [Actinophytocola sp.]HEU5473925.1 Scr1 family TA system antitoxin-like transcriptional regulator [Actinophytocola sp.]